MKQETGNASVIAVMLHKDNVRECPWDVMPVPSLLSHQICLTLRGFVIILKEPIQHHSGLHAALIQ